MFRRQGNATKGDHPYRGAVIGLLFIYIVIHFAPTLGASQTHNELNTFADIGRHNAMLDDSDPYKYCQESVIYKAQHDIDIDPDATCQIGNNGKDYADHALQLKLHQQYITQHPNN